MEKGVTGTEKEKTSEPHGVGLELEVIIVNLKFLAETNVMLGVNYISIFKKLVSPVMGQIDIVCL